jgi:ABC-type lipoprotein release transport system permease subunit
VLRLLRLVSLRDYLLHRGRLALIVAGVATGVALIAALDIINASVVANFRTMLTRAAGSASLQVVLGTGEVGFPADTVEVVSSDPDVSQAIPLVRGTLVTKDDAHEVLQLFGVDLTNEAREAYDVAMVERDADDLELLNDPDAVLLTEEFMRARGIALSDRVAFATPTGIRRLRVRGTLQPQGLATIFGGSLAVMDLFAAQRALGKEGRIDQIDVVVKDGRPVADAQQRLAARLPESLSVVRHSACSASWRACSSCTTPSPRRSRSGHATSRCWSCSASSGARSSCWSPSRPRCSACSRPASASSWATGWHTCCSTSSPSRWASSTRCASR